jgi:hypothetical protein
MPGESTPAASEARRPIGVHERSSTEQSAGSPGAPRLDTEAGCAEGRDERSALSHHAGDVHERPQARWAGRCSCPPADRRARLRADVPARLRDRARGRRGDRPPRRPGDAGVGVLNAAIGLGALVGSLLASTITWNGRHARCLGVGAVLGAPRSPSSAERPRRPPRCCSSPRSESATRSSTSAPTRCPHAWRPTP